MLAGSLGIGTATDFKLHGRRQELVDEGRRRHRITKLQAFEDDRSIFVTCRDADMAKYSCRTPAASRPREGDSYAKVAFSSCRERARGR